MSSLGTSAPPRSGRRVFYGWWVAVAVFVVLATTSGLIFYLLTVFLRALTAERGFSVSAASGATAVFFLVSGLAGLPLAALLARRDPRITIVGGALVAAGSLLALGRVSTLGQLYGVYAALGIGFAGASLLPATTLITRWFARRRSLALSLASTGLSVGGVAFSPYFAGRIVDDGLPTVAPWLALGLVVGVVPVTLLLVRAEPASLGLQIDGDPQPAAGSEVPVRAVPLAAALRSRYFAAVTAMHLLGMVAQVGGIAHLFPLVAERVDTATAATALSVVAFSSLAGRLLGSWLLVRLSLRPFAVGLLIVQGAGLVLLVLVEGRVGVLGATVVYGATFGNVLLLHPLLLAEGFGVRDYPRIFSRSNVLASFGLAGGPALIGLLYDATGGYRVPMLIAGVVSALGAAALLAGGRPPVEGVDG